MMPLVYFMTLPSYVDRRCCLLLEKSLHSLCITIDVHSCTALPRTEFLSNHRPDTQRQRRRGEEKQGSPRTLICCSPASPPLPPHTARLLHCLGLRYQDINTPPSPIVHSHRQKSVIFRKSGQPLFRDPEVTWLNSDSFCDSVQT